MLLGIPWCHAKGSYVHLIKGRSLKKKYFQQWRLLPNLGVSGMKLILNGLVATNLLDIIFVMATSSWTVALWCRSAVMPGCKGMVVSEPLTRAAWSETVIEMPRQWQMAVILHLYVNDHLVVVHKIFSHGVVKEIIS